MIVIMRWRVQAHRLCGSAMFESVGHPGQRNALIDARCALEPAVVVRPRRPWPFRLSKSVCQHCLDGCLSGRA